MRGLAAGSRRARARGRARGSCPGARSFAKPAPRRGLFIAPHVWRAVNLLVTPLTAGFVMSAVGRLRGRGRGAHTWLSSFMAGSGFAFGMALVRFMWAKAL